MTEFHPDSVLITGATGGIGSALAEAYARPGIKLILQGRNQERLTEVASRCRTLGAEVHTRALDLKDQSALSAWLGEVSSQTPVDLVIANAGVNTNIGPDGAGERWENVKELLEVNVIATLAMVDAVLPAMRSRGRGQIALISSLAAYYGLPMTPSYSASKAALKAYGEAIRSWLAPEGIRVNVVMPGFVESQMCRDFPGPKAFVWPADKAARAIMRGLEKNKPRISFPFPLNLGSWFLSVLPPSVSERLLVLLKYRD